MKMVIYLSTYCGIILLSSIITIDEKKYFDNLSGERCRFKVLIPAVGHIFVWVVF